VTAFDAAGPAHMAVLTFLTAVTRRTKTKPLIWALFD